MKPIEELKLLIVRARAFDARYDLPIPEHTKWFSAPLGIALIQVTVTSVTDDSYPDPLEFDGIIISGSTHSAYEQKPWMPALEDFIRLAARKEVAMLGICFGHQIIAKAFGGLVELGGHGAEFGATPVYLTQRGTADPLFEHVPENFEIVMVHEDIVVDPPIYPGFHVLSSSDMYTMQACAYGDNIRSLQFHPEYSSDILEMLVARYHDLVLTHGWVDGPKDIPIILERTRDADVNKPGRQILMNFRENFMRT
jgi:GMP synthase (glutamine-hydrolysing)